MIIERKQKIMWKLNPTVFEIMNQKVLYSSTRLLGTSIKAVNTLCSQSEEMKYLLPLVIGSSADNTSVDWQGKVEQFWNNLSIAIPETGMDLDTSLEVSYSGRFKKSLEELCKRYNKEIAGKSAKETEVIAASILTGIDSKTGNPYVLEDEMYLYTTPVNVLEYLYWRYALLSPQVANDPNDVNKSSHIRFYIHDEDMAKKAKESKNKEYKSAMKIYNALIVDEHIKTKLFDMCIIGNIVPYEDLIKMQLDDMQVEVGKYMNNNPSKFIELAEDPNIAEKARIEKYIKAGLLRKLENSETIVDSKTLNTLGYNLLEVVAYMKDEKNKPHVTELSVIYKSLKK